MTHTDTVRIHHGMNMREALQAAEALGCSVTRHAHGDYVFRHADQPGARITAPATRKDTPRHVIVFLRDLARSQALARGEMPPREEELGEEVVRVEGALPKIVLVESEEPAPPAPPAPVDVEAEMRKRMEYDLDFARLCDEEVKVLRRMDGVVGRVERRVFQLQEKLALLKARQTKGLPEAEAAALAALKRANAWRVILGEEPLVPATAPKAAPMPEPEPKAEPDTRVVTPRGPRYDEGIYTPSTVQAAVEILLAEGMRGTPRDFVDGLFRRWPQLAPRTGNPIDAVGQALRTIYKRGDAERIDAPPPVRGGMPTHIYRRKAGEQ